MKIVYLSEIKWRYLRTRKQQMVRRFPKDWQIFFVEPYARGRENRFRRQRENNVTYLTVPYFKNFSQAWLQRLISFVPVRAGVILINACWLWLVLRRSKFRRPNLLVVSNIYYGPVVRLLFGKTPVIYDCNDNHLAFPMTPSWARGYFLSFCRRADCIVCSSLALKKRIPPEHHHKVLLIGNGVDASLFARRIEAIPENMQNLPRPILLYLGALSEWIDMPLLLRVAEAHPDKSLVLIGPVAPGVQAMLKRILQKPNAHYLGEISHDAIAQYLAAAEVCLIPFIKNELTAAVNPNKLYEYFAAGKAVVSVDISPEVIAYGHEIFLASDHESFLHQIDAALAAAHTHHDRRRQLAFANDWQEKADQFSTLIKSLAK
ncbi:MAG: glycosyltransferase [bacterium]